MTETICWIEKAGKWIVSWGKQIAKDVYGLYGLDVCVFVDVHGALLDNSTQLFGRWDSGTYIRVEFDANEGCKK